MGPQQARPRRPMPSAREVRPLQVLMEDGEEMMEHAVVSVLRSLRQELEASLGSAASTARDTEDNILKQN